MLIGGQVLTSSSRMLLPPAGSIVTSDAEWDAALAASAADLAGKTITVQGSNFTGRTIDGKDVWAAGGRLTIRSADASSSVPSLTFNGVTRGFDLSGLNFQMTGWPYSLAACVYFNNGTFGKIRFLNGTSFRHGYGAGLVNIDTAAALAEYERIDNVRTATTSSATYALTWKDAAAASGWIEFFNRGANSVRVEVGGAGVVATGASPLVAAGARLRISGLVPASATHFAVLATAATSEVNARTEIGLTTYLAQAFFSSGAATLEDIEIRNCTFRDLASGVKGLGPQSIIVMDCDFDRIYQDIIAATPKPGGSGYYLRNLESIPFSRSGIAENLTGDAGDPHGDQFQMFGAGTGTIGPVYYAGNRIRPGSLRAGVNQQGVFVSDNDLTPSYSDLFLVSTMQVGGATNGLVIGEGGFPARDAMIYGATVVKWDNATSTVPAVSIVTDQADRFYIGSTIAPSITAGLLEDDTLRLSAAASPAAVFPNLANLATATTRAQIEAAITTAAEGTGLGAVATANAIDWATTDHEAVILWASVPSGVHWVALTGQAIETVITLPLRKVLNPRASQTVSVGAGTEWRSVATDGTTQVQAWTTSSGTIEPDQFIQIRVTSGASEATVTAAVTINGFVQDVAITSTVAAPTTFLIMPATIAHFGDTATLPAATTRLAWSGKFYWPTGTISNGQRPFSQVSDGCELVTSGNGFTVAVEDGTQTQVLGGATVRHAGKLIADTWLDIVFDVDQVAQTVTLTINGATEVIPFTGVSNGVFNTIRRIGFLATQTGSFRLVAGVRCADLSVARNGAPFKAISNAAATANADAWKLGAGIFTNT